MPTKLAGTKYTLSDDFNVARSVVSVASPISVRSFGAKGDGVTDDTAAIQAALNSGFKEISFPGGVYSLGVLNATAVTFNVNNREGLNFVAQGDVKFTFSFANNSTRPVIFSFNQCSSVRFDGNFTFTDLVGYNASAFGVKAIQLANDNVNFDFQNVTFSGVLTGIEVAGTADSRSVKNIKANIVASNVYYVLNCIQNGDDIDATIHATGCRREYFVYGVRNHRIRLTIVDKHIGNASIIGSYELTNKTENISLDLTAIWAGAPLRNVLDITHQPNSASGATAGIDGVSVNYDVRAGGNNADTTVGAILLRAAVDGGNAITSNCNCVTSNLVLSGTVNGHYYYDVRGEYTLTASAAKGRAFWPVNAKLDVNALKVLHQAKTFTWTPVIAGTGWAIGDGATEGRYTIHNNGDSLSLWGKITFGSTSTFDNNATVSVELPILAFPWANEGSFETGHPSSLTMVGMANLWDSGEGNTGYHQIPVKTTGDIYLVFHGNGGYLLGNAPFVWASGDTIQFFAHVVHANTGQLAP
jgi:hypothetical protein